MTKEEAIKYIKIYSLIETYHEMKRIEIIVNDEFEVFDDILCINEEPWDNIRLETITRVWNYNEATKNFELVWENNDLD